MRLIRGASGSGKTALVFREFAQSTAARKRIVVPTATLVRHYQHELARAGLVFDPNTVISFSRFAIELAGPGHPLLAPATLTRALVRDALTRLQIPEFTQVAATRGMADVVLETITRFENANCTPDRVSKIRSLSPLAKAFLRVWKEVESGLAARGFCTRGQLFRKAAQSEASGTIWLDGFLKFSLLESNLLRALAANCDLTLTLTDGPATLEAHRLALELGAADQLLPAPARHTETIAVTALSPEREADEIARRILELNSRGTDFPDIAVAIRDVESWLPLLRNTFDRFGIPARYYFSTPARKHPVAVFLTGLIAAALDDWDFATTLAALRAHPAWGRSADFDRFDFKVRETMPGRGRDALLALCDSPTLKSHLTDCLKVTSWRNERLRPADWQRRFQQLAATLYRVHTIHAPLDYAALETARSHAAGLRAWSAALDTAAHYLPEAPVLLEQFNAAVTSALDGVAMQIPDNRRNVIHVMSAFEARQWQVRSLFICGMTAKDYPRRASANLLLTEADLRVLPLRDDEGDESLLFDSLRTRATQYLILTVSARDAAGNTIVPSTHFTDAALHESSVLCRPRLHPAVAQTEAGVVTESALGLLRQQHQTIRLTSLEELAKCRFRFFADRTLNLKGTPERPNERLSFSALGLIVHEAMETWLANRTHNFVDLFETTFDAFCQKKNIQPGYNLEVKRVELRRIAGKVNETIQWPFVTTESEVECSIDFPGGIVINGRIDRIDHLGNGDCVILDYKSGKVANVKKLVERETSLQGPLYALAVREKKQLNAVAMVFLAIREDKIYGWGNIPGATTNLELIATPPDWIDSARDRTIARLQSFLAGDVHPEPTHPDDCTWCDYKNTCRVSLIGIEQIGTEQRAQAAE